MTFQFWAKCLSILVKAGEYLYLHVLDLHLIYTKLLLYVKQTGTGVEMYSSLKLFKMFQVRSSTGSPFVVVLSKSQIHSSRGNDQKFID